MHVLLIPKGGMPRVPQILVRRGQEVTVGRTEWADYAFPHDTGLQPIHFSVTCHRDQPAFAAAQNCQVCIDGQDSESGPLRNGQVLLAGNTEFRVLVEGAPDTDSQDPADVEEGGVPGVSPGDWNQRWSGISDAVDQLGLEPLGDSAESNLQGPLEFVNALQEADRLADAICLLGWCLPSDKAVAWLADCVRTHQADTLTERDKSALEAALDWADSPGAETSRAAESIVESIGLESPAAWVAQFAFWSGDDISAPGTPPLPPPVNLAAAAAKGTIVSLAYLVQPTAPNEILTDCAQRGQNVGA